MNIFWLIHVPHSKLNCLWAIFRGKTLSMFMCLPTGTAQRLCSRAKGATQWKWSKPGGVEQVVGCLRSPAGPPEPEAEDQTCDEAERWEYLPKTGENRSATLPAFGTTHIVFLELQCLHFINGFLFCVCVGGFQASVPGKPAEEWFGGAQVDAPWCSSPQVWSQQSFPTRQGEQANWNKWTS